MIELNRLSRIKVKRDENKRLRDNEIQRKKMVAKWVEMSKNSPFHNDLADIEDKRMKRKEDQAYRKRLDDDRNALIDSMIGTSKFDPCNPETIRIFDNEPATQLSLSLRRVVKDKKIVKNETNTLHQLMDQAFTDIQRKFPAIQFNHEGSEGSVSPLPSKVLSTTEKPETKKTSTSSKKKSTTLANAGLGQLNTSSLDGGSSTITGSGSMYHSPQLNPGNFEKELDDAFDC